MKDLEFEEIRKPLIEYEEPEPDKDPFVPAKEAPMDKEKAVVYVEL